VRTSRGTPNHARDAAVPPPSRRPPAGVRRDSRAAAAGLVALAVQGYKIRMAGPPWFQTIVSIAGGVLTILGCLLALGAGVLLFALWRMVRRVGARLTAAEREMMPLVHQLRGAVANVDAVTATVRRDVDAVHQTVTAANAGARSAISRIEERARRLDALAGEAQVEIEGALVGAVAAARGVRAGAVVLRDILGGLTADDTPGRPRRSAMAGRPTGPVARHAETAATHDSGEFIDAEPYGREPGNGRGRPRTRSSRERKRAGGPGRAEG